MVGEVLVTWGLADGSTPHGQTAAVDTLRHLSDDCRTSPKLTAWIGMVPSLDAIHYGHFYGH
jgi:hypothetical protein